MLASARLVGPASASRRPTTFPSAFRARVARDRRARR
jgi:hypothetical protein